MSLSRKLNQCGQSYGFLVFTTKYVEDEETCEVLAAVGEYSLWSFVLCSGAFECAGLTEGEGGVSSLSSAVVNLL